MRDPRIEPLRGDILRTERTWCVGWVCEGRVFIAPTNVGNGRQCDVSVRVFRRQFRDAEVLHAATLGPAILELVGQLAERDARKYLGLPEPRKAPEVDELETWLYRYFDAEGLLLYVGVTCNLVTREQGHRRKHWFRQVARRTEQSFPDRASALAAERHAIATERPMHNGTPKECWNG